MKNLEASNLFDLLSVCLVDKVVKKEDRYAIIDAVLALNKVSKELNDVVDKAKAIENNTDRNEYINKFAFAECSVELPSISKDSVYELAEGNKERLNIGGITMLFKLVKQ